MFNTDPRTLEGQRLERTLVATAESDHSPAQLTPCEPLPVMPTGQLLELIESTAFDVINRHLEPGYRTVGGAITFQHFAATPVGWEVTATLIVRSIRGRKCVFDVTVKDPLESVCTGTYTSYVVRVRDFLSANEAKKNQLTEPCQK